MPIGIQEKREKDPFEKFLDQLKEPREVIQQPDPIPEPEPEINLQAAIEDNEPDPVLENKKLEIAMIPAETIVDVIDTTAISVNSYIAKEHVEGASEQEKQSLQKAVANYLRETDVDISPGKMLIILVLMIYGPKILQAFQLRKVNLENEALKARVQDLETQLKEANNAVPSV